LEYFKVQPAASRKGKTGKVRIGFKKGNLEFVVKKKEGRWDGWKRRAALHKEAMLQSVRNRNIQMQLGRHEAIR